MTGLHAPITGWVCAPTDKHLNQQGIVAQLSHCTAIVGAPKTLQHQTGKQLVLRKLFRAVLVSVRRQPMPRCGKRR